jgi:multiple sugar transport system substrate-binding protein
MAERRLSRRALLVLTTSGLAATALLASCAPASPKPTEAPTSPPKPTEAPKPAAEPTKPAAAAQPAAQPAAPTAGAPKPAAGQKVELSVAHAWPADRWQEQVDFDKMFMEKNPSIVVKATNTEFNEYFRKILAQAGSNTLPDVMYMQDTRISQWVRQGSFRSLDGYTKGDKPFQVEDLATEAVKLCTFKGQLHAIPYDWGGPCLVYNKTMFDEAKIKYPDESWTLENLLEAAKAMTNPGKQQWGWDYSYIGNWAMESMYFRPFGADVFNDDETGSLLASDAGVAAMQWWSDLLLKHKTAPTPSEKQAIQTVPFAVGRVAMYYAPPWNEPTFIKFGGDKLKWDVAPMPKGPKDRTSAAMGSNYAITKDSKNPDAAWTYTSQYMSKDGMEFMWSCRGTGIPTRKSAQPCFLTAPTHPPGAKHWVEGLSYMKMGRPVQPAADEVIRIMTREYDNLFLGQATAKEAHEAIKKQIDPLLAKNKD